MTNSGRCLLNKMYISAYQILNAYLSAIEMSESAAVKTSF